MPGQRLAAFAAIIPPYVTDGADSMTESVIDGERLIRVVQAGPFRIDVSIVAAHATPPCAMVLRWAIGWVMLRSDLA